MVAHSSSTDEAATMLMSIKRKTAKFSILSSYRCEHFWDMKLKTDCPRVFDVVFLDGLAFLGFLLTTGVVDFSN